MPKALKRLVIGLVFWTGACANDDPGSSSDHGSGSATGSGTGATSGGTGSGTSPGASGPASSSGAPTGSAGSGAPGVGSEPGSAPAAEPCDGPLLPMAAGNRWTYRVTDSNGTSMKTSTVMGLEPVGGTGPNAALMAFRVVTQKVSAAGMDMTESWQGVLEDGSVVRYRELGYQAGGTVSNGEDFWDPYKLRVDESPDRLAEGAAWQEMYMETKVQMGMPTEAPRSDGWAVDAVDVPCGPVSGLMHSCIQIRKTVDGAATGKTYLFARCVGKVREQGTQLEELVEYSVD